MGVHVLSAPAFLHNSVMLQCSDAQLVIMDSRQVLTPCKHLYNIEQVRLRVLSSLMDRKMNVSVSSSVPAPETNGI